jgi:hypothetical protein
MTDCEKVTDRMALVAHGGAEWSAEESGHLADCADCGAEWRLVQAALRLGDAAARRIDPAQVGRSVLVRLAARRRRQRASWVGLLAAAAALTAVVWTAQPRRPPDLATATSSATEFHLPLAELEDLDVPQLQSVLDGLDAPIGAGTGSDAPALGDLRDSELERVLRSLEG